MNNILRAGQELDPYIRRSEDGAFFAIYKDFVLKSAFQPIVTPDGEIFAFEALLRVEHASGFCLDTGSVIESYLEHTVDLINVDRLSRNVHLRNFARLGLPTNLFINVTPIALLDSAARQDTESLLLTTLSAMNLSPSRIYLEVLEHPCDDEHCLTRTLHSLRRHGVKVAVDDYGMGASSMSRTTAMRPDVLKISKPLLDSYVAGDTQPMIEALSVAAAISAQVLIEGIEDQPSCELAKALGADLLQGYFTGRPCSIPAYRPQTDCKLLPSGAVSEGAVTGSVSSLTVPNSPFYPC